MPTPGVFTPYSTVDPLVEEFPGWVPELDQSRIASYQKYDEIYWSHPEAFKILFREESEGDEDALYIPNGRIIVDTIDRYVGAKFRWSIDPAFGAETEQEAVRLLLDDMMVREQFQAKFRGNKLYGLMRGDWLWHIVADPEKPEGERISIHPLDPGSYFPITLENNIDRRIGCHIAEQILNEKGDVVIRRLTYRKDIERGGIITVEEALFELDDWGGPESEPTQILRPPEDLPPAITALPVYHVKTFYEPGNPFGSSVMRGLEVLSAGVNRTVSDEDLALALEALGMYVTSASEPRDKDGNLLGWQLGPGRVVKVGQDDRFDRVSGISSVEPYQTHIKYVESKMYEAGGANEAARGTVEVQVAESGVALALRLAPVLTLAERIEEELLSTHQQLGYDLPAWLNAYEGQSFALEREARVRIRPMVDPSHGLPTNRKDRFEELVVMLDKGIIDPDYFRDQMRENFHYEFPADIGAKALAHLASVVATAGGVVDPEAERAQQELQP